MLKFVWKQLPKRTDKASFKTVKRHVQTNLHDYFNIGLDGKIESYPIYVQFEDLVKSGLLDPLKESRDRIFLAEIKYKNLAEFRQKAHDLTSEQSLVLNKAIQSSIAEMKQFDFVYSRSSFLRKK
jgi:hypothetical protein